MHLFPSLGETSLLSIGQLCDAGCTALFTANKVTIKHNNTIILQGSRSPHSQNLWNIPLSNTPQKALSMVTMPHKAAEIVQFFHAALFSPSISTLKQALKNNILPNIPGLTMESLTKYPPVSVATHKGHMDQSRANQKSTKPKSKQLGNKNHIELDQDPDFFPTVLARGTSTHNVFTNIISPEPEGQVHTDQTGRFPVPSTNGNNYVMVLYAYDANAILVAPLKSRSANNILIAYKKLHARLVKAGIRPKLQRLDNECSELLKDFLEEEEIDFQLSPPGMHRRNSAERAIRTFKNHFIAGLSSTDPKFPLGLWDYLLPQAEITLNLMRQSRLNPNLSAYTQISGVFDFNRTPLAPPGTQVLVHEKPSNRASWDPHGVDAWYIGPAMDSYRCYKTWVWRTKKTRITDTLEWFPHQVKMPTSSPLEMIVAATKDIAESLSALPLNSPFPALTVSQVQALQNLNNHFSTKEPNKVTFDPTLPAPKASTLPHHQCNIDQPLRVPNIAHPAPVLRLPPTNNPGPVLRVPLTDNPDPVLRVITQNNNITAPQTPEPIVSPTRTTTRSQQECQEPHIVSQDEDVLEAHKTNKKHQDIGTHFKFDTILDHRPSTSKGSTYDVKIQWSGKYFPTWEPIKSFTEDYQNELATTELAQYAQRNGLLNRKGFKNMQQFLPNFSGSAQTKPKKKQLTSIQCTFFHQCLAAIHPDTGKLAEYPALLKSSDGKLWEESNCEEIGRLADGYLPNIPKGTKTLHFIRFTKIPKDRKATYLRIVVADRPMKSNPRRVRWTVGGDQVEYPGDVSTKTSDMVTAKILFNSILSTDGAKFMGIDLKDFYLNADMDRPEYIRIPIKVVPQRIRDLYQLDPLIQNEHIYAEINKTMYGLPQAGKISNDKLVPILSKAGYHQSKHIPGLFKHETRPVAFALVVDDFGVKYVGKENAQHLVDTLKAADYKVTTDWDGTSFCGIKLKWDYDNKTVDLSMPGYIEKALQRFMHPTPTRPTHAPHTWLKPQYGAKTQLTADPDNTPLLDKSGIKHLQSVVGTLLFYARAIDNTMLVALGTLAAAQTKGTEATMDACTHLLNYAATHPDATIRFTKSDMILVGHSDASYLSESEARSRAGGYFYLGSNKDITNPPSNPNGPIHILSTIMNQVLASATEAEVGALFYTAQDACTLRTALIFLGHHQPATPLQTDNACAEGIANDTVKAKRSKAMDMRFYWIRDRVKQGQFLIHWKPGTVNLADYFTKHHPATHHKTMRQVYLYEENPDTTNTQSINHCEGVKILVDPTNSSNYAFSLLAHNSPDLC